VEVYRHKGKVLQRKYATVQFQPVWHEKLRQGKRFYEINREHPVIKTLTAPLKTKGNDLAQLLRFIEETVPVPLITIKESEQPEMQSFPFEGVKDSAVLEMMNLLYASLIAQKKSDNEARSMILNIEPFNNFPQLIDQVTLKK
jgi:hypothetical protein